MEYSKNHSVRNSLAPVVVMYVVKLPATQVHGSPVTQCSLRLKAKDCGIVAGNVINRDYRGQKRSWIFGFTS